MRYGLPYKGSKNGIAEWIVDNLPAAETFCDLFFGGGAITHRAMLSGKYKNFVANDIDKDLPVFFLECAYGQHTTDKHTEWISRDDFDRRKITDTYISLVWSFSNNRKDYLYGKSIEAMKCAYHKAIYFDDIDALKPFGFNLTLSEKEHVYDRYLDYQKQLKTQVKRIENEAIERQIEVERLQSLQSLQSIQRLRSLKTFGTDYQNVPIPDGSLIYCDIPYVGTNCGNYQGFDHQRFYEWAAKQDNIYISEYQMPEDFVEVAIISKSILSASNGNSGVAEEKIFTNRRTYDQLSSDVKERISLDTAKQTSIFDFL